MNKLNNRVGLLVTVISVIIGSNLSFKSSVRAEENDRSSVSYLDPNELAAEANLLKNLEPEFSTSATQDIHNSVNPILSQIEEYSQLEFDESPEINQIEEYSSLEFAQFPRVSDLQDVTPEHWAYEAVLRLVNNYRCLKGYEDNNFRGDRPMNRYEFAAALNTCLRRIERLIPDDILANQEDLETVERLQREFADALTQVNNQVDDLDQRTTFLEERTFSTTTILRGQVEFQLASAFGDQRAVPSGETPSEDLESVVTLGYRARLNFETSFTGKDLFRTRIEAGNLNGYGGGVTGTEMTALGNGININSNVRLGQIFYRFPLGNKGNFYIASSRQSASTFIPTLNRASTISLFGFNNPLYDLGFGAGVGFYYQFSDLIGAGLTYYSGSPNNPESDRGFFNGDYSALGQVTFTPSDNFGISFSYARFFTPEPGATNNVTGFTGSLNAQLPFGASTETASDNVNMSVSYRMSDRLELGGWLGYTNAIAESSPTDSGLNGSRGANADIWNWALTASYSDLGKLGSKLSFIFGMPPKLTDNDVADRSDDDTSLHLELSYNYPITDNISITPGVLAITNPEHNDENGAIVIGLVKTTFIF